MSAPNPIGPGITINAPDSGGGGGGTGNAVPQYVWRPAGVASASVLVTWPQVEAVIAATSGLVLILVDTSLAPAIVPNTADTECFGRVQFGTYSYTVTAFAEITVADGGRLKNPHRFVSCTIRGAPTVRPFIELTIPGGGLFFERGPGLILDAGATQSAIHVAVGSFVAIISNFEGGSMQSATAVAPAIVDIDPLNVVLFAVIAAAGVGTGYAYPVNTFSGAAAGSVTFLTDASAPFNPQTLLLGSQNYQPFDKGAGVIYDDALVAPTLGATDVQAAIDALKVLPGNALPVVFVLVSQVAPLGFTYVLAGNGIVLTLAPGTNNGLIRVLNAGTGNSVVADITAPDSVQDDAGAIVPSFAIEDYINPGGSFYSVLREWQFASGPNVWARVLTQNTHSFLNGVLLSQEWTPGDPARPGFTNVVTTAGQTIDTPDPATVGSGPSAMFAICKLNPGALTIAAFVGSQFASPDGAGYVTTYNADAWPEGSVWTWQYLLSSNTYGLVSASPPPAPAVFYDPVTPANWVAPPPANVSDALDRIAAVVSLGGATPIP